MLNDQTPLNIDSFYLRKKAWHFGPWFFTPTKVHAINALFGELQTQCSTAPSAAHRGLYARFSSPYFWQQHQAHPRYTEAKQIWASTYLGLYLDNHRLLWFFDYACPLLEEYLHCALKDCLRLETDAKIALWQKYLPGHEAYLEEIKKIRAQLAALKRHLSLIKTHALNISKIKIAYHSDALKYLAQKIDVPCDFHSARPLEGLSDPHITLDKNPPIISPDMAHSDWQTLTHRLRLLKKQHRFIAPALPEDHQPWFDLSRVYFFVIQLLQKTHYFIYFALFTSLFFTGWMTLPTFCITLSVWLVYPLISKFSKQFIDKWKKLDTFFQSYSHAFFHDFLVEHTEYIESIERSALWRKNRLNPGCAHIHSFHPDLLLPTYEGFQHSLSQQIRELNASRPYFWQFWRYKTHYLYTLLIKELTLEQEQLNQSMSLYATDLATRIQAIPFLSLSCSLNALTVFITRFSPHSLDKLDLEKKAIQCFLSCLREESSAPVMLRRALCPPLSFATHCPDVHALSHLFSKIQPEIKNPLKQEAIFAVIQLMKQVKLISLEQLDNYVEQLETPLYPKEKIKQALQHFLLSTFTGHPPEIILFFSPQQRHYFNAWLETKQKEAMQAHAYFQEILNWPDTQDWGKLPLAQKILPPECFKKYLALVELSTPTLRTRLQDKFIALAPHYTGAPSDINQWIGALWQQNYPTTLIDSIIQARFSWTLHHIAHNKQLDALPALIEDTALTYASADNPLRLSRSLVHQAHFYLPWNTHIQQALHHLEHKGLLLAPARAAYSQKSLQEWLTYA